MIVSELIEKLKALPQDTPILLSVPFTETPYVEAKFTYYNESQLIINQFGWAKNKKKEDGPLAQPL